MYDVNEHVTARETQIAGLVAEGCTDREIARRLHLAVATVNGYVLAARGKTHARNRAHLAAIAVRNGWVAPPPAKIARD